MEMTREEVLFDIAERCGIDIDGNEYVMTYDRDKMIKFKRWLFKELKNADKEPCEDCVSRTQALSAIRNLYPSIPFIRLNFKKWQEENKKYFECENVIRALPSVIPTRKKGKWVKFGQSFINPNKFLCYSCSECGLGAGKVKTKFCPNCGTEMENEE